MTHRIHRLAIGTWLLVLSGSQLALAQAPEPPDAPDAPDVQGPAEPTAQPDTPDPNPGAIPTAEAETPAPSDEEAEAPTAVGHDEQDILVTGTRIRSKTSFTESAPVEIIDRRQLERSGVANVADALQYLTVAQGNATAGLAGEVGVNLRGLGVGATLLLVNGRRTNPSATGPGDFFSDISIIPLAAVERIEVLKAGAAAIYGADAVAGVVNVITRRGWNGARGELNAETTSRFDLGHYTASGSLGAVTDRSRILIAASYDRHGELTSDERAFTQGKLWSAQGYPGAFSTLPSATMPAGLPMADPGCGPASNTMTVPYLGGQACKFDYRPYTALVGNSERANAFANGEYDLTKHTTAFGELIVSRFRGDSPVPIYSVLAPYPVVPANHVDNPYGVPLAFLGSPAAGRVSLGNIVPTADDTMRGLVGFKGDLAGAAENTMLASWTWELSASIGISRFRRTLDDALRDSLQLALNSCSDPANLSGCFNPFYSATDGTGTANSQQVIDTFAGREMEVSDHALQSYNAGMSGSLFNLPGGELGVAFGGEVRHEWRSAELDHDQRQGRYAFLGLSSDGKARRDVYSGYVELRWPFWPGIELQTAGRVEHYSDTAATPVSPFVGLSFVPSEAFGRSSTPRAFQRLQLRANVSKAFRAPTIFATYPGAVTIGTPLLYQGAPQYIPVKYLGNPALQPETAQTFSAGMTWTPIDLVNFSADYWYYNYINRIESQVPQQLLDTWVQGGKQPDPHIVVDPVTGSVGPVIASTINVGGSVITSGLDLAVTLNLLGGPKLPGPALSIGAQGTYTINFDVARRETSPITLPNGMTVPYPNCDGPGPLDRCHVVGLRNVGNFAPVIPRLKLNVPIYFGSGNHSVTATGHYISSYGDDLQANMDGTFKSIPAWLTLDLQYAYNLHDVIGKELTLRAGCMNVFDRLPPYVAGQTATYDAEVHDPRGRMYYVRVSSEF